MTNPLLEKEMQRRPVEEHISLQAVMYCEETQCSAIIATRNWCFTWWSSVKQYSIAVAVSSVCWWVTIALYVTFACSSCDRGGFSLHVRLSRDSKLSVGGSMCESLWSEMDRQPGWDEFLSVAEIGMTKQRITDYLSLTAAEEMSCIIADIPPTASPLYKQGAILLLRRPTVISKLNTNVPMGSTTGLVIL